ncbi:MAG: 3-isopropylmalate dehydrogenase [Deltaproteobacteria bacterium]|nr:3-isopropylmalate dehydrogenase [Deltaproteobacteria bacterium]
MTQAHKIAVLAGDGSAPEFMAAALKVLEAAAQKFSFKLDYHEALVGGAAYDKYKHPLPPKTLKITDSCEAILFGSVGRDDLPQGLVEKEGLLALRKYYGLFANLRPATIYAPLAVSSSLKTERLADEKGDTGFEILTVRELGGGAYFGDRIRMEDTGGKYAADNMKYSREEIVRILKVGFEVARKRKKVLHSIDKANVLDSSKLWRSIANELAPEYPDVKLIHQYVDNAAMQIATWPRQFDVIVTENLFGDILSDLSAAITGSLGLLPSASLNEKGFGMYEPSGGTAPDLAGLGIVNPIAQIRSAAMMLSYSFKMEKEAQAIETAVKQALEGGARTIDICGKKEVFEKVRLPLAAKDKIAVQKILQEYKVLSTDEMAAHIIRQL